MSELFDEVEADKIVLSNLLSELRRYKPMAVFKLDDGTFIKTDSWENVPTEELESDRLELIDRLAVINDMLGIGNEPTVSAEPASEQPVEVPAPVEQPVQLVEPVSAPTPAVDPNQAAQVAPPSPIVIQ